MSNLAFVAAAFSVTWLVLLGYMAHLHRVTRRARAAFDRARSASAS